MGLGAHQFGALALLVGYGALATSQLAELLCAERTTVTRNLAILRKRGLVEEAPSADRRVKAVQLRRVHLNRLPVY